MKIGYAWIGKNGAKLERQKQLLEAFEVERVYRDDEPSRPTLAVMSDAKSAKLRNGDVLYVLQSAYLGETLSAIHWTLADLAEKNVRVFIIELDEFVEGNKVLAEMTEAAEVEKRKKQTEPGRARLKKLPKGKRGGRPKKDDFDQKLFTRMWLSKKDTIRDMADEFKISTATVRRRAAEYDLGGKAI